MLCENGLLNILVAWYSNDPTQSSASPVVVNIKKTSSDLNMQLNVSIFSRNILRCSERRKRSTLLEIDS